MLRSTAIAFALLLIRAVAVPWADAAKNPALSIEAHGDGRTELIVAIHNRGAAPITVEIPAGLLGTAPSGARLLGIRSTELTVAPSATAEAALPAVPLSLANKATTEPYTLATNAAPATLRPLLDYSARTNDLPRPTAQLTALLLSESVTFAAWRDFLGHEPKPEDVGTAIDALALARQLDVARTQPLADDAELRLRALRLPLVRGKAMLLFGMAAPEGIPVPDVNQLLHTKPGDNCPICRMRAQMTRPADNGL